MRRPDFIGISLRSTTDDASSTGAGPKIKLQQLQMYEYDKDRTDTGGKNTCGQQGGVDAGAMQMDTHERRAR